MFALLFQVGGVNYILAKAVSYTVGAFVSYLLNRKITFGTNKSVVSGKLPRFVAVNALAVGLSLGSMYIMNDVFSLPVWIAYFVSILFSFSTNFLGNRFWVFREESDKK